MNVNNKQLGINPYLFHLFILDTNALLGIPLSRYLSNRFRNRLEISVFFDANSCMEKMTDNTNVIVLNYLTGDEQTMSSQITFNAIRSLNPKSNVVMIESDKAVSLAAEEIQYKATKYMLIRESEVIGHSNSDKLTPTNGKGVFSLRFINKKYLLKDYLLMIGIVLAIALVVVVLFLFL